MDLKRCKITFNQNGNVCTKYEFSETENEIDFVFVRFFLRTNCKWLKPRERNWVTDLYIHSDVECMASASKTLLLFLVRQTRSAVHKFENHTFLAFAGACLQFLCAYANPVTSQTVSTNTQKCASIRHLEATECHARFDWAFGRSGSVVSVSFFAWMNLCSLNWRTHFDIGRTLHTCSLCTISLHRRRSRCRRRTICSASNNEREQKKFVDVRFACVLRIFLGRTACTRLSEARRARILTPSQNVTYECFISLSLTDWVVFVSECVRSLLIIT